MSIKKKLLFILIGDDKTGKTTFQKLLIKKLHGIPYDKLPRNQSYEVEDKKLGEKYTRISYANRSYQEKADEYGSVDNFFAKHFNGQDIAIIASHLDRADIELMLRNGKERFYNVIGVFFTNSILHSPGANAAISGLNWDERLVVENPHATGSLVDKQLDENAESFAELLIKRAKEN